MDLRWSSLSPRRQETVIAVAGGSGAVLLLLPFLCFGLSWDQGVFSVMADVLCHGGLLYRDAWEHKPPGVYWTYWLTFALIGRDLWIVRAVEIAALALSSAAAALVARRWTGSVTGALVAALALPAFYFLFIHNSSQPETFQIPLLLWALVCRPEASTDPRAASRSFFTGILLSGIVLYKTPGVLLPPVFLIERLLRDARLPTWKDRLRLSAAMLGGLLLVPVLTVAYYSVRGAFPELLDAWLLYPYHYSRQGSTGLQVHVRMAFDWTTWLLPWAAGVLILLGVLRGILLRPDALARWAVVFGAGLGTVMIQSKYFPYHHMILCPLLALGMAFAFVRPLPDQTGPLPGYRRFDPAFTWLAIVFVLVAAVQFVRVIGPDWSFQSGLARIGRWERRPASDDPQPLAVSSDVIRRIREETSPEDRIFVWGDEPWIYFNSDRRMAGPYSHLLLIVPVWAGNERLQALLQRLDRERPRVIIVTPGEHYWRGLSIAALLARYPEMREYLRDRYTLAQGGTGYQLWKRTE